MKISVVIATYKRPALLKRCLEALLAQDLSPSAYEIIVVGDGFDISTQQVILDLYAANIHYFALPEKKGPAAARNLGWQQAAGELIAFTDDDTIPDRGWLSAFRQAYHGELMAAYTGRLVVPVPEWPTDYELNTARLETAAFITANCACAAAALALTGGFDERFATAWREDSDLEFKLLQAGIPIRLVQNAVVVHPVRPAPWGISLREQRKSMYNALLFKKFPRLYRARIQPSPVWSYYIIIGCALLCIGALLTGRLWLASAALMAWFLLTLAFTFRRLAHTVRNRDHVTEMFVTSLFIPFLSVYWTLYGAWKYRVFFL